MNGIHDLGGMHGFGPMVIDPEEPLFHAYWESRVFALRLACGFHRKWNADMGRYARECMPPAEFLSASYYERGLYALEQLLVASTLIGDPLARQILLATPQIEERLRRLHQLLLVADRPSEPPTA